MDNNNLNIEKEINNDSNNNNIINGINAKKSCPIIIKKLQLNEIKEKIKNNEIYLDNDPPSSPSRTKFKTEKRKIYNSLILDNFNNKKQISDTLFNEESKSDDEENINDKKIELNEEEGGGEREGRKSIYNKYSDNNKIENNIFDNTEYIKKLEEKWKYEKILLDYNIIDFTSK